ncbi:MAG: YtxH domain-containing protein [Chloroflexi bacterium]|nr:YtxH domain-containing protein [Chloroflexota bacterium]
MSQSKMASFTVGFVLGAAVGTTLALLMAPAQGRETRQRFRSRGLQVATQSREVARKGVSWSKEAAAQGRSQLASALEGVKAKLRPETVSEEPPTDEAGTTTRQMEAGSN